MRFLLFLLVPFLSCGQDCGYLFWQIQYQAFPSNYQLTISLSDECDVFKLIIDESDSFSTKEGVDTITLKNSIVAPFIRLLDHTSLSNLNSLENAYLNDGLYIDYFYVTRQEEVVAERLHFPIVNLESLLYMEEEIRLLHAFHSLYGQYLNMDQLRNYDNYIKPLVYSD